MKKYRLFFVVFILAIAGISTGWAIVNHTIETYAGTCGQLDGFPGLLQKAAFLPNGNCLLAPNDSKTCADPGAECLTNVPESGEPQPGVCRQLTNGNGRNVNCQCKPGAKK